MLLRPLLLRLAALLVLAVPAPGQTVRPASTPRTVWLDLRPQSENSRPQAVPAWVESLETENSRITAPSGTGDEGTLTIFRIRLGRVGDAEAVLVRVYFDDSPGASPTVSAWDELGAEIYRSPALGDGLDLPNAKSVVIPTATLNYLEIAVPGDGTNLRIAHLSWLQRYESWRAMDVAAAPSVIEPYRGGKAARPQPSDEDRYENGVVTAALAPEVQRLAAAGPTAKIPFTIEKAPLIAVVSFEVLGADLEHPPELRLNGRLIGEAQYAMPDLADPGIRGELSESRPTVGFRYSGWLRAQRIIPTFALGAGDNLLELTQHLEAGSAVVRNVEIQLKYPFEQLDVAPVQNSVESSQP